MTDHEQVKLRFSSGETSLSVRRFQTSESLSRPFEVNAIAQSDNHDIELASIVGKDASFELNSVADSPLTRTFNGICSHFALLHSETEGASTYLVRIVPKLWLLTQRRGNRIFQRMTYPEIVQKVLGEFEIAPKLKLSAQYQKHDFVVQYDETDFNFVSRLLERAGITYSFDFASDSVTELVLNDTPHLGTARSVKPNYTDKPSENKGEYITRVRISEAVRPGAHTIRGFDFRRAPDFPLVGEAKPGKAPEDFYEHYDYEPGSMKRVDPPDGTGGGTPTADDKGKVRHSLKEGGTSADNAVTGEQSTKRQIEFESNCNAMAPGILFSILDHPRSDLGPGDQLLVLSFRMEGIVGQKWCLAGKASYASQPYFPTVRTEKPQIHGVQSALVVGPPGKEIYTDEFGRVRVQFHWDREGKLDDNSSCWMRASQDWAGAGYGAVMLPRVGQEVLVAFLEGDPDEPMIVGRVYNEKSKVPYKLPDHKTRSTWKSDSSPHSGGFNEILLEDKAGKEIVYHQAQRDRQKLTKREETERVGNNREVVVGKNRSSVVNTVDATMVGGVNTKQMISPPSEADLKIPAQDTPSLSPLPTTIEMVAQRLIFTTGQATVAFDGGKIAFEASGNITLNAKGGDVILEGARSFINTISPPPAPKPGPVRPVEPGTFKPDGNSG